MASLDFSEKVQEAASRLKSPEAILGKMLTQPMSVDNAGARKIMYATHHDHSLMLLKAEQAIIETGYEIRYGDYSSSITKTDRDYQLIAKISKFSFAPNHHYWLIFRDTKSNMLDVQLRISYEPITESYGYLYNNEYMDNLHIGDYVPAGTILQKSLAFDEYNNRKEGLNLNVAYLALDDNMEDSVILSDVAAGRMSAPLIKPVQININDNDIPLNIYGDDNTYKVIPDIGEDIIDANLIALRKEKKEESYFNQSVDQLRRITMSDDKRQVKGKVIDVDIYCNNPDILDSHYYAQLKMYYEELHRYAREMVETIMPYVSQGYQLSYELQKIYANAKRIMNNDQYIDKRPFSNIILNITVLEELKMNPGDKVANRYGGKGVCSDIWPQSYMPRFKNSLGKYEYVDLIFNSSTMVNRENVGQSFELSLTHIGCSIIDRIISKQLSLEEAYGLIYKYVAMCSPQQAEYMEEKRASMSREELIFFVESIVNSGAIHLSMRPISDNMTIDKMDEIYKAFPFVTLNEVEVPLVGSDGDVRYIKARRPITIGKEYIHRLKQFAEEKFSATSLSSTNIRNENTKSRVKKDFRELYPNTPIRFGNMETNNQDHLGAEVVISNMMIHSLSPQGRRLVEQMYTGDPLNIDIKLDSSSKNRSAEIVNTYLKTIGRRMVFKKTKKKITKISISPVTFDRSPTTCPVYFIPSNMREGFDYEKEFKECNRIEALKKKRKVICPVKFDGRNFRRKDKEDEED
jgi:DNA-directed RNA polymerase beta subunit